MQGTLILVAIMAILFAGAYFIPSFAGLFILAGLAVGCVAILAALSLLGRNNNKP